MKYEFKGAHEYAFEAHTTTGPNGHQWEGWGCIRAKKLYGFVRMSKGAYCCFLVKSQSLVPVFCALSIEEAFDFVEENRKEFISLEEKEEETQKEAA